MNGPFFYTDLLAADRVYLLCTSPHRAVSSYLTPFTLTSEEAVSFLWHFPWGSPRSPLATVASYAARTFLPITMSGGDRLTNCLVNIVPLFRWSYCLWLSSTWLTRLSACWLNSRLTCEKLTFSNRPINSLIRSLIGQRSRFFILYIPFI